MVFAVEPSEKDVENALYWTSQTKAEFTRSSGEEVLRFVNGTSDEPFDVRYYTYEELPENIRDSVINASEEDVFGPYREEDSYKLVRLHDSQMRPDSVRVRHILLSLQTYQGNTPMIEALADSLMDVINNGGNFNQLALEFSSDESNRAIGGDLGWFPEGQMVTEFNDASFGNNTGDLVTAETQFGTHIIRIEDQS